MTCTALAPQSQPRTPAQTRSIRAAEFRVLAALLRRTDVTAEARAALLTNNVEIILSALDGAGELPR